MKEKIVHGANIFEISRRYGFAPEEVKDFSSNVNPLGPSPKGVEKLKQELYKISVYPDMEYHDLKNSIVQYTNIKDEHIILGSGTTELIKSYIHFVQPQRACLIIPCYSEYERELRSIGATIFKYALKEETNFQLDVNALIQFIQDHEIEFLILTNPNNPTATGVTDQAIENGASAILI